MQPKCNKKQKELLRCCKKGKKMLQICFIIPGKALQNRSKTATIAPFDFLTYCFMRAITSINFNFAFTFVLDILVHFYIATDDSSSIYHAVSISKLLSAKLAFFVVN